MKAIDNFDTTLQVKFSTYAVPMIIGEIRRYLRDNSTIRVSRSLRDTAYKAIYARENYLKNNLREPTIMEIASEIGMEKEEIVYALDAIQSPMSLYEPVYTEGGDTLYVMDQVSDKKNKEENWVENLALQDAMNRLNDRERHIVNLRFYEGKTHTDVLPQPSFHFHRSRPQFPAVSRNYPPDSYITLSSPVDFSYHHYLLK